MRGTKRFDRLLSHLEAALSPKNVLAWRGRSAWTNQARLGRSTVRRVRGTLVLHLTNRRARRAGPGSALASAPLTV